MGDPAEGSSSEQGDMAQAGAESDALPDLSDEETLDEALEQFEGEMQDAAAAASEAAAASQGQAGGSEGEQQPGGGGMPGQEQTGGGGGSPGEEQVGQGGGVPGGPPRGQKPAGGQYPAGKPGGGSPGTMTRAEQVAILDGELERSTGAFDDLILQERDHQRRTVKDAPEQGDESESMEDYGAGGSAPPMYGSGGGGGGGGGPIARSGAEGDFPQQAATFPAPKDIPSGDDDDVVARQLREAAMRESDPQLREKLWDEYRKYKGIDK